MSKLQGKVALVTGSGRGVGQAIALKLAKDGAKLVINDLDEAPAMETTGLIKAAGSQAVAFVGDVTTKDFGERFINAALDAFERIDIIVNNAGYPWDTVIQKVTDEQWYAMLDVHASAPFRILRAAADYIRTATKSEMDKGEVIYRKVVNISSIAGLYGNAGQIGYSAGKSAIIGMTKTLAKEWGRYNVNVNCVAFGLISTRITQPIGLGAETADIAGREIRMGIQPEFIDQMIKLIPLGRAGTPDDAAGAVYLFCLPESNYITGEVLLASGGFVI
jgi:3-oxoacyl-[acyl-carrier protein] reductase